MRTQEDSKTIRVVAFDADDTLWQNEALFVEAKTKFKQLLSRYSASKPIVQRLDDTESYNLRYFGYGVKSFTLSMVETAIELTNGQIQGQDIQKIIAFGKEMLTKPVQLLEHVQDVVEKLSQSHQLMLITKGDLLDQERKILQSGLAPYFSSIEIVSDKTPETYKGVLAKYNVDPQHFLMVGNSLRSDILPVIAIGGQAVHIPHHFTWSHEIVTIHENPQQEYFECEHISLLLELIEKLEGEIN